MQARILAAALLVLAAAPAVAADGIQPGQWKIVSAVVNNGKKLPSHVSERCLTEEQASDLASTFSPRFGGINTSCKRTQYAKSAHDLSWRLECRGSFNMDSDAKFTFFSPLRYTATISNKGWIGDRQVMDQQMTLEGNYVGGCRE